MSDYNHKHRQIGQQDEESLILENFYGPVELWRNQENERS